MKREMAFKTMTDAGLEIITPEPASQAEFIAAADKVHQKYGKEIGDDYMRQIYAITGYSK
jgi:TRAP-type C4-dicarboxylate transport system substrate-binding protein